MRTILALFVAALLVTGCADTDSMRSAPATAGVERQFAGNYAAVSAATLDSIRSLNVSITSTEELPTGLVAMVSKSVSAFSWGEVGRVMVVKGTTPTTPVRVYWEKRSTLQITGTGQDEFAGELFKAIEANLARTPNR